MTNPADAIPQTKEEPSLAMKVAQLQAALVDATQARDEALQNKNCAIQRQGELEAQLDDIQAKATASDTPCCLLSRLPIEIRNQIYSLLLVSPLISQPDSINRTSTHGTTIKLDLSPSILRANRQIYHEASEILYGSNTFRVECLWRNPYPMSPITRKIDSHGHHEIYTSMALSPAAAKVKHWKVIITAYKACTYHAPSPDLVDFCRAICTTRPASLTVMVIPEGLEEQDDTSFTYDADTDEYHKLTKVVSPLGLFRGVGAFRIMEAAYFELPTPPPCTVTHGEPPRWGPRTPPGERSVFPTLLMPDGERTVVPNLLMPGFKKLVEGDRRIEYAFKMQKNLLTYAQAFEQHIPFKVAMDLPYGAAKRRLRDREGSESGESCNAYNPYKTSREFHPVEDGLERAFQAADSNSIRPFKKYRSIVLDSLKPQYQRICAASMALNTFIKYHKTPCGIFEAEKHAHDHCRRLVHEFDDYTVGLILLEAYVQSFKRDVTDFVALQIRKYKRTFDLYYSTLPRAQFLVQISQIHEREMARIHPDFDTFVTLFRQCVDDCDAQYLEIRNARKALFDWDITPKSSSISTEAWRCDEMVDWEVNEAPFEVPEKPIHLDGASRANTYGHDFGAFLQNILGPGGAPLPFPGAGQVNAGVSMTFGSMQIPIPPPTLPPNTGNPGPPPAPPVANLTATINQALNALQGILGPGPGFVATHQPPPPITLPAAASGAGAPHAGAAATTSSQASQTQASALMAQVNNNIGGLNNGQWFDDSDWTSSSGSGGDDVNDKDDEDEEYDSDEGLLGFMLSL